jgi:hypothetical protein
VFGLQQSSCRRREDATTVDSNAAQYRVSNARGRLGMTGCTGSSSRRRAREGSMRRRQESQYIHCRQCALPQAFGEMVLIPEQAGDTLPASQCRAPTPGF